MNRNLLPKNLLGLLLLLVLSPCVKAQMTGKLGTYFDLCRRFADKENKMDTVQDNKPSVWLNAGLGYAFADAYDSGVSGLSMFGLGFGAQAGPVIEWNRCHIHYETRALVGILMAPVEGFNIDDQRHLEFLYRIHDSKRNRLHLWVGGSLQMDAFFKIIPSLGNASTSSSIFGNLCAEGMAQYDFAYIHNGSHNLLTAYGKLTLLLGGLVNRPGYSFMDNYTSNINLANTILSSYETSGILFPGVGTDIGIWFNMLNGNKIGCSYRWDYLTTRNAGYYRFDNAFHAFTLDLMIKLN